jgi:hypothetical protein
LKMVPGSWEALVAVGVPTILILSLLALPLLDTRSKRSFRHRPLAAAALVVLLAASGLLFGAAIRESGPEAPAEVGRVLSSKERAGRSLFRGTGCLDCHVVADEGTDDAPDLSVAIETVSAAYLGGPSWAALAGTGAVEVTNSEALATADTLFASRPPPFCGTFF